MNKFSSWSCNTRMTCVIDSRGWIRNRMINNIASERSRSSELFWRMWLNAARNASVISISTGIEFDSNKVINK